VFIIISNEKAALKMLVKLRPVVNFINILQAHFQTKVLSYFCQSQNITREKLRKALLNKQHPRKMLVKLGPAKMTCCNRSNGKVALLNVCACGSDTSASSTDLKVTNKCLNLKW